MLKIAPSILAADPMRLGEDAGRMLEAGADLLHLDIMDAHFVPNLSFGPHVAQGLRRLFPDVPLDVHLMMTNPETVLLPFIEAGASAMTIHTELDGNVRELLGEIRGRGVQCGLSLKPATPAEEILSFLGSLDLVLIMTVEPGFGGQSLMPEMLEKAAVLRKAGFAGVIAADGGLTPDNAGLAVSKGVDQIVMGSALYRAEDPRQAILRCREYALL